MPTYVETDELVFLSVGDGAGAVLEAVGVTTCICFALYGRKHDGTPVIGMYHWSGFSDRVVDEEGAVDGLCCRIATQAREQLDPHEGDLLYHLDKVFIIGGERRQEAPDGTLLVTGTEREIVALKRYFPTACEEEFERNINCHYYNFLTAGDESLTVRMKADTSAPHWFIATPEIDPSADMETDSDAESVAPTFGL